MGFGDPDNGVPVPPWDSPHFSAEKTPRPFEPSPHLWPRPVATGRVAATPVRVEKLIRRPKIKPRWEAGLEAKTWINATSTWMVERHGWCGEGMDEEPGLSIYCNDVFFLREKHSLLNPGKDRAKS